PDGTANSHSHPPTGGEEVSCTCRPPAGAGPVRVTVTVTTAPILTWEGSILSSCNVGPVAWPGCPEGGAGWPGCSECSQVSPSNGAGSGGGRESRPKTTMAFPWLSKGTARAQQAWGSPSSLNVQGLASHRH